MGGNRRGVRVIGSNQGSGRNRGSGGGGGIYAVDESTTWAITATTTDTPYSVNGESGRLGVPEIGYETTTMNASSFKGSGAGA